MHVFGACIVQNLTRKSHFIVVVKIYYDMKNNVYYYMLVLESAEAS